MAPTQQVHQKGRFHPLSLVLAMLCVLIASVLIALYLVPMLNSSATVTIVPVSRQITADSTMTVVTGQTQSGTSQIPGRELAAVTMSQAKTTAATGTAHQEAQAAHGVVTFYNAAPSWQTVSAGTLLTGADGVQIVTDQDASIPAVNYPTLGQATVTAHAVTTGPGGNIRAGDIYGTCCRLNVSAVNSVFSGGQDARSYTIAKQQDINTVATNLKTSLDQSVQAALQTQIHSDETLITPLPCKPTITSDHQAGEEATQVQVTVSETCSGAVYNTQQYQSVVTQIDTQEAAKQLGGEGYTLAGDVHSSISQARAKDHNTIDLTVKAAGTWVYQFSQEDKQHIMALVAGKSKAKAITLLEHVPGVQAVSLTVKNNSANLPTDSKNIHLVFLLMG
jgi:hypothetical protein